jgi:S-adenosylmethionine hydrolase
MEIPVSGTGGWRGPPAINVMIVLLTDFGLEGPYIGQVAAVLHRQAPGVPVINLFSDLPPFDIQATAYLLPAYTRGLSPGTVCLCVVDPGVGGKRPGCVVAVGGRWYVGPDEGLFTLLARQADIHACHHLPVPQDAAPSFHGRDVFAPAAAWLARQGRAAGDWREAQPVLCNDWPDDLPRVLYVDRFGNAITGLRAGAVGSDAALRVNGQELHQAVTFSEVGAGQAFWYVNSNGLVEIAVNRGRADVLLGLEVGTSIEWQGWG